MMDLLTEKEWLLGFSYPLPFNRLIDHQLLNFEPWYLLEGKALRQTMDGLALRYPNRKLIPFARRQDNDDIACWQVGAKKEIFLIHDFASPSWEQRNHFMSFYDWLRRALEDFIEFDN